MATSSELRRGGSHLATGVDSEIFLGSDVTTENLAAELAKYPHAQPGSMAYNRIYAFNPAGVGALCAMLDLDGKWYTPAGAEVT